MGSSKSNRVKLTIKTIEKLKKKCYNNIKEIHGQGTWFIKDLFREFVAGGNE